MDFDELKSDVKTILVRQVEIKIQVDKTNGRVSVLEKFMWTIFGGATVFGVLDLNNFIQALNK